VVHAARLKHVQGAVPLAAQLDVAHEQPRIDQRRDGDLRGFQRCIARCQVGEQGGNVFSLQVIHQPHQHRLRLTDRASRQEVADWVEDHDLRFELLDQLVDRREVHFQAVLSRA
jgi:hypothetical protein